MNAIQEALGLLVNQQPIEGELVERVAREILTGQATPGQIGAFLMGLRLRGERTEHLMAFAQVMRGEAAHVEAPDRDALVDTCGTGGDHAGTFNISTTAALIAAGAGVPVAKHGNRAVTGTSGSADVLQALGVRIDPAPSVASLCLAEAGCAFLFAPVFHGAIRHAGPVRREIGVRTIFNMLGPLANPAGARRQVIGVYDRALTEVFAEVLLLLGSIHVMIVHGHDGLDEITLTGRTQITEGRARRDASGAQATHNGLPVAGERITYDFDPRSLGLDYAKAEDLKGGTPEENAAIIRRILAGEPGPRRAIAELNAAAAIVTGGRAASLAAGFAMARAAVDSGAAARVLEKMIEVTNRILPEPTPA